jgi:hypothetical protein
MDAKAKVLVRNAPIPFYVEAEFLAIAEELRQYYLCTPEKKRAQVLSDLIEIVIDPLD